MSEIKINANAQAAKAYARQGLQSLNTTFRQTGKPVETTETSIAGEGIETAEAQPDAATLEISSLGSGEAARVSADRTAETVGAQRTTSADSGRLNATLSSSGTAGASEPIANKVDMAKEMESFKAKVLTQTAQFMQAQANSTPQGVMSLLR